MSPSLVNATPARERFLEGPPVPPSVALAAPAEEEPSTGGSDSVRPGPDGCPVVPVPEPLAALEPAPELEPGEVEEDDDDSGPESV